MTSKVVLNILDKSGKQVDKLELDGKIWEQKINKDLLHKTVVMNLANKRFGTASTKTRDEVRGGGKKPWRQKGTGSARAGSIRSPIWRGGGIVFGPHPRDYSFSMPKKMKAKALLQALILKLSQKNLIVLSDLVIEKPKTKEVVHLLKKLKIKDEKTLLVDKTLSDILKKAAGNIANLKLANGKDLNTFDILNSTKVILTKEAFTELEKRVKR